MVYRNKWGDEIYENVERFDLRGTIMSVNRQEVGEVSIHRMYVEDSKGGHSVTVWDNAKGYNPSVLRVGNSVRFRGIIRKNRYMDSNGAEKVYEEYKALEMMS